MVGESKQFTLEELDELKSWLKNPLIDRLLNLVISDVTVQWITAPTAEERELCWQMVNAVEKLHTKMTSVLNDQKLADYNAQRKNAWTMPPKPMQQ